jgi:hypothetical protein
MANMQNIKAPIGKYNLLAGFANLAQPGHKVFKGRDFV